MREKREACPSFARLAERATTNGIIPSVKPLIPPWRIRSRRKRPACRAVGSRPVRGTMGVLRTKQDQRSVFPQRRGRPPSCRWSSSAATVLPAGGGEGVLAHRRLAPRPREGALGRLCNRSLVPSHMTKALVGCVARFRAERDRGRRPSGCESWAQRARNGANALRISAASSTGSASAGKWPPRSCSSQLLTV